MHDFSGRELSNRLIPCEPLNARPRRYPGGEPLGIASPSELFTLGLFSVLDAMMDAPMIDVIGSLPLAAEMREALVSRKGKRGILLDCVTALETGEISDMPSIVANAGELYLESMMWASAASESLFSAAAAPSRPKSTPPPVSIPAQVQALEPLAEPPAEHTATSSGQPGLFGRIRDTVLGWFGRRRVTHESA